MRGLRLIKAVLAVTIVAFAIAAGFVSLAVFERQKALREVSRYNMVWAVSQAIGEFYRFETRVAAFGEDGAVDQDEVRLRFDILQNRLGVFQGGEVNEFADTDPDHRAAVAAYAELLGRLAPLVERIDRPGVKLKILTLVRPFEAKLARLAAAANTYGGEQVAADQQNLVRLHWMFSAIAAGLVLCGIAFITLLFFQNRLLAKSHRALREMTDDLRLAKNAAEAASEAKSRFLATMSHELRTPLNAVIGFSEVIANENFGPVGQSTYKEYAGDILRSGQHMLELVTDILTMAKLDAGRYEVELQPIDLRATVERTVTMFRGTKLAGEHPIKLASDGAWPAIAAGEREFRQMLLNLLSNAAKFSDPGSPIEVRCDPAGAGEVALSVLDRGIGMNPAEIAEVVRPFHQADSRLARKYEGTGLGLSIVVGLMSLHRGRLAIDSQPGRGSRVSLIFPRFHYPENQLAVA